MTHCVRHGCTAEGVQADGGGELYCSLHCRLTRMRREARNKDKRAPPVAELEALLPADMRCPKCSRTMNWFRREGASTAISLQHWRDGSVGFLCFGCNSRHRDAVSDEAFWAMPLDHKRCPKCGDVKPLSEFGTDNRNGAIYPASYCRCCDAARCRANKRRAKEAVCA